MATPNSIVVAEAGRLLYGAEWQTPVAEDLGLNLRTVQRIAAAAAAEKAYRIPPGVLKELASRLMEHSKQCDRLADWILAQDFPPVEPD